MLKRQIATATLLAAALSGAEQNQSSQKINETKWTLSTDLLILRAKEDHLGYTTEPGEITSPPNFTGASVVKPHFEWNYGFREKFAYDPWDGKWEFYLQWTHIINRAKGHKEAGSVQGMFPVWVLSEDLLSVDYVTNSELKWHGITNVLDGVYGYHFRPVRCLILTPWAGLRSEWIDQHVHVKYSGGVFPAATDVVHMENDFWGLGPVVGFNPEVFLGKYWSILVSADVAMLGGQFETKQEEFYVTTTRYSKKREFGALRWNVDFLASLKWRIPFCHEKYAFTLQGGWESHWFFNQNQLSQNEFHLASSDRDLTLRGWFASLMFAF
jgi:hypothetical protein